VQEQLSEVWIHENADLAGMRKAEVESVKAFASRQSDNARPAYGHFLVKQKRHSIEVATTNSDEYLQSQTGNRGFWPLTVGKMIDLDLLRRDRLQLLGEAAKYETAGENITLDEKLWPASRVEQEKRRTKDPWEDIVADIPSHVCEDTYRHYRFVYKKEGEPELDEFDTQIIYKEPDRELVASTDLLTRVLNIPVAQQHRGHRRRLATVMKLAGWERSDSEKVTINGKQVRGYFRPTIRIKPQ
jgi:predicted P-loop ATPase